MTAARRRAIDSLRRGQVLLQKHEAITRELEWQQQQLAAALEHLPRQLARALARMEGGADSIRTSFAQTGEPAETPADEDSRKLLN